MTLYQLLDEMLDSGIPVNTHPGGLKVLVPPPNLLNRVSSTMFGHQGVLVSDQARTSRRLWGGGGSHHTPHSQFPVSPFPHLFSHFISRTTRDSSLRTCALRTRV